MASPKAAAILAEKQAKSLADLSATIPEIHARLGRIEAKLDAARVGAQLDARQSPAALAVEAEPIRFPDPVDLGPVCTALEQLADRIGKLEAAVAGVTPEPPAAPPITPDPPAVPGPETPATQPTAEDAGESQDSPGGKNRKKS